MLFFFTSTISKTADQIDKSICCCSFLLYWLYARNWYRSHQPMMNTIEFQVLPFISIMLCGIILTDLFIDLFGFSRVAVADGLVRVSRYYTFMFQIRSNYVVHILLVLQPLSAIYGYFFLSLSFLVLSFGMVLTICFVFAVVWNELVVNIFHYSKVYMIIPGSQKRLPATFDYLWIYRALTIIHCAMFIALITTLIII
jgi:hypothetical protein